EIHVPAVIVLRGGREVVCLADGGLTRGRAGNADSRSGFGAERGGQSNCGCETEEGAARTGQCGESIAELHGPTSQGLNSRRSKTRPRRSSNMSPSAYVCIS